VVLDGAAFVLQGGSAEGETILIERGRSEEESGISRAKRRYLIALSSTEEFTSADFPTQCDGPL
jgi:hypothetical protein